MNEEVLLDLPKEWTSQRLPKNKREAIMDKYEAPRNFPMVVSEPDKALLKGQALRRDLALRKSQLMFRDSIIVMMHTMHEAKMPGELSSKNGLDA